MRPIADPGRRPSAPALGLLIAIAVGLVPAIAGAAPTDDLADERSLPRSAAADGADARTDPATVPVQSILLPDAIPPSASMPGPAATAPGAYFERPALVVPPASGYGQPYAPAEAGVLPPGVVPTPGMVADPPITYLSSPSPRGVEDIDYRDGPRIPEPMVFDLVRGLGARRGELEVNVLNLVPFRGDGRTRYEWAPEIEYAVFDGFAVEFELPIFNTQIEATKYAAQYTLGTAFDDAFIHGIQGIVQHTFEDDEWSGALLYLAGIRLDRRWSLFGMFGFNAGQLVFPFDDITPRQGLDLLVNVTVFYDLTDDLLVGVETNLARNLLGPGDILIMPQVHWSISEHYNLQFGVGVRDTGLETFPELGFRVIWER